MSEKKLVLAPHHILPEVDFCWQVVSTELPPGDTMTRPIRSGLELLENGLPFGTPHAAHDQIRLYGGGLYSHWGKSIYFSTPDGSDPRHNGREYSVRWSAQAEAEADDVNEGRSQTEGPLFPNLEKLSGWIGKQRQPLSRGLLRSPAGDAKDRIKMLEAKVEFLLDELYAAKSALRMIAPKIAPDFDLRRYQVSSFDYQWREIPFHEEFLSNPDWRAKAAGSVSERLGRPKEWFEGKSILDCGCGPGRHAWTFSSLGAKVTGFDLASSALAEARKFCASFPDTLIEERDILSPLPYGEFDLVWCYGVIHHTGDTYGALRNIARHVKTGGLIYLMVYPEPQRNSISGYVYQHEISAIRQLTQHLGFAEKAELAKVFQGAHRANTWFDGFSSQINDTYTPEELSGMLHHLGFDNIRRTMLQELTHNFIATRNRPQD
jgi:2-polyprenyl-3-methyl-5-hydroxy-6-metoxy-1,4-benzoquinol methylase